jgi:hypothetical protein
MTRPAPVLLLAISGVAGLAQSPAPAFEVASVKPATDATSFPGRSFLPGGRFAATNLTLRALIQIAYDVPSIMISRGSSLLDSGTFDVDAKALDSASQAPQLKRMLIGSISDCGARARNSRYTR